MDGEIGEFIQKLRIAENAEKMKDGTMWDLAFSF
jgi:hypothetical protein